MDLELEHFYNSNYRIQHNNNNKGNIWKKMSQEIYHLKMWNQECLMRKWKSIAFIQQMYI